ncbi:MarR family transcriptional regulator [Halostagnicola sp. A-GB9-2]|uniref:MarR family transcriptional regulator n=1 Tax=Halostagnicola sp. A-GB9-2 TaxID=3048066 RepID=UPI0024BF9E63|nr:MarR family transcriptional regulator [Halostagnicola sp. A-GB9-2]MDJ1434792.1 MarR family transcriptional regulator [Halostagnicola sp. A-GB9-2]
MSLPDTSPDVDDLPWSAKHLLYVLEEAGGSIRRDELQDRTEMPPRTLDRALTRLEDVDVVRRDRDNDDDLRFVRVEIAERS